MWSPRSSTTFHRRHTFAPGVTAGCTRAGVAFCRTTLARWIPGLPDEIVGNAALVTAELVANAARHAGGPRHLVLEMPAGDTVWICVTDASPDPPLPKPPSTEGLGGYGLAIVERLTTRWDSLATDNGKAVWADAPVLRP